MTTMMINGTSPPNASSDINFTGALTPDALMLYCRSRLGDLDDKMDDQFEKQKAYRDGTAALNRAHGLVADGVRAGGMSDQQGEAVVNELNLAIEALPDGPQKKDIIAQRDFFTNEMKNDGDAISVDKAACEGYAKSLDNLSKDLGTSAELDMMTLQSLMSQRQTAIQISTNLIQSLGESSKTIAQKIGA